MCDAILGEHRLARCLGALVCWLAGCLFTINISLVSNVCQASALVFLLIAYFSKFSIKNKISVSIDDRMGKKKSAFGVVCVWT